MIGWSDAQVDAIFLDRWEEQYGWDYFDPPEDDEEVDEDD